jgi:ubiquitin carboxyl-terminal hydrolase 7
MHSFMFRLILSRIHDLEIQSLYSNPIQFYDFLQNRVMIIFRPKSEADYDGPEFSLVLSKKQTYDTVLVLIIQTKDN